MENTKQVLIAEKDKTIRTALTMVLQEIGLKVFAVDNGVNAMENVRTREIDLVITNLLLPQLNGIDLIKNTQQSDILRKMEQYKEMQKLYEQWGK